MPASIIFICSTSTDHDSTVHWGPVSTSGCEKCVFPDKTESKKNDFECTHAHKKIVRLTSCT